MADAPGVRGTERRPDRDHLSESEGRRGGGRSRGGRDHSRRVHGQSGDAADSHSQVVGGPEDGAQHLRGDPRTSRVRLRAWVSKPRLQQLCLKVKGRSAPSPSESSEPAPAPSAARAQQPGHGSSTGPRCSTIRRPSG